jgi:hypothetical protein
MDNDDPFAHSDPFPPDHDTHTTSSSSPTTTRIVDADQTEYLSKLEAKLARMRGTNTSNNTNSSNTKPTSISASRRKPINDNHFVDDANDDDEDKGMTTVDIGADNKSDTITDTLSSSLLSGKPTPPSSVSSMEGTAALLISGMETLEVESPADYLHHPHSSHHDTTLIGTTSDGRRHYLCNCCATCSRIVRWCSFTLCGIRPRDDDESCCRCC